MIEHDDNGLEVRLGSQSVSLERVERPRRNVLAEFVGCAVCVGVRAEAVEPHDSGELVASLESTEVHGGDRILHATLDAPPLSVGEDGIVAAPFRSATINAVVDAQRSFNRWAPLRVRIDGHALHFFDLATGAAMTA